MLPKEIDQPVIHPQFSPSCKVDDTQSGAKVSILGKLNAVRVKPPMFRGDTTLVLIQSRSDDINILGFMPQPHHICPPIEVRIEINHPIDVWQELRQQKPRVNHPVPIVRAKTLKRINCHGNPVDNHIRIAFHQTGLKKRKIIVGNPTIKDVKNKPRSRCSRRCSRARRNQQPAKRTTVRNQCQLNILFHTDTLPHLRRRSQARPQSTPQSTIVDLI